MTRPCFFKQLPSVKNITDSASKTMRRLASISPFLLLLGSNLLVVAATANNDHEETPSEILTKTMVCFNYCANIIAAEIMPTGDLVPSEMPYYEARYYDCYNDCYNGPLTEEHLPDTCRPQ